MIFVGFLVKRDLYGGFSLFLGKLCLNLRKRGFLRVMRE